MSRGADKVALAWIKQEIAGMAGSISFDGVALKSYDTVIATRWPHFVLVHNGYRTRTTQAHKAAAVRAAAKFNLPVIMVPQPVIDMNPERAHKDNLNRLRSEVQYAQQRAQYNPTYSAYAQEVQHKQQHLDLYEEKFGLKVQLEAA